MKLASFFLASILLHAAALTYPVLFFGSAEERLVPVEVLILEEGRGDGPTGKHTFGREAGRATGPKHHAELKKVEQPRGQTENPAGLENPISIPVSPPDVSEGVAVASEKSAAPAGAEISTPASVVGAGGGGWGGQESSGAGTGFGVGSGDGGKRSSFAQVSYAYSPKPHYPDRARSEGWEGTVVLRVLVDEEGKSKLLEVNRSSGFETLDAAALETVSLWRFYPARYGERRVKSWVRVPIIFRLADLKD